MKWKRALTVEEAALLVTGFITGETIESIQADIYNACSGDSRLIPEDLTELSNQLKETESIYSALLHEAKLCGAQVHRGQINNNYNASSAKPTLKIALIKYVRDYDEYNDPGEYYESMEKSTFTKESLAQWFYEAGDIKKAQILMPNFKGGPQSDGADEIKKLEEEYNKLFQENDKLKRELEQEAPLERESNKPYPLIAQLVKIINPDADFTKYTQLHSYLEGKLKGSEKLAVSPLTLQTYLGKR